MKLKDKVAIVTGAGTGIGKAICEGFAREGADVLVVYNSSREGADDTVARVEAAGRRGVVFQADVANVDDINAMVAAAYDTFGRIDILVSNAAARNPAPILDYTPEYWDHLIDANLRSMFVGIKAVTPIMIEQGGGKIINIGSMMGYRPCMIERAAYCTSKRGIMAFTKSAAIELGPMGIYVNALAPGTIETAIGGIKESPELVRARNAAVPLRRRGMPEDIIGPAVFLASDDSSYVTGITLLVDGGYIAGE